MQQIQLSTCVPAAVGDRHLANTPRATVPITVVIPALNEAPRIRHVVMALRWAGEVIVADGGSGDGTPELAQEAGAKVLDARGGTIASQRNAGIAVARNHWILALDADERVSAQLRDEIAIVVAAPQHEAYRIPFRNFYLGHEMRHGRWGNESHVRLLQSDRRFVERRVHEHLEAVNDVGLLRTPIEHNPYRDLTHHLEKMSRYARWAAEDLALRHRRSSFGDLTVRPLWRFTREYVVYGGWKDGRAGLLVAALSACSALMKYAHLQALEWQAMANAVAQAAAIDQPVALSGHAPEAPPEARLVSSES